MAKRPSWPYLLLPWSAGDRPRRAPRQTTHGLGPPQAKPFKAAAPLHPWTGAVWAPLLQMDIPPSGSYLHRRMWVTSVGAPHHGGGLLFNYSSRPMMPRILHASEDAASCRPTLSWCHFSTLMQRPPSRPPTWRVGSAGPEGGQTTHRSFALCTRSSCQRVGSHGLMPIRH